MNLVALRAVSAVGIVTATDYANFIEFAVDGVLIQDDMDTLFRQGKRAKVPFLSGSSDFESGMVPKHAQRNLMTTLLPEDAMEKLADIYGSEDTRDTMSCSDYVFHSQASVFAVGRS